MIIPWLIFMAVGLITYAGFLKLAACLLRYSVSWKFSFLFAGIMLVAVIFDHVLVFSQPVAITIGHGVMRLMALAFAMMIVVTFAIVIPVQVFLSNHLSPPP